MGPETGTCPPDWMAPLQIVVEEIGHGSQHGCAVVSRRWRKNLKLLSERALLDRENGLAQGFELGIPDDWILSVCSDQ